MNYGQLLNSIIGGVAVLLLALIGRIIARIGKKFDRFMAEHVWLIATTLWTRDKVVQIMTKLQMPIDKPPPDDLQWNHSRKYD